MNCVLKKYDVIYIPTEYKILNIFFLCVILWRVLNGFKTIQLYPTIATYYNPLPVTEQTILSNTYLIVLPSITIVK